MGITRYDPDADSFGNFLGMKSDDKGDYVLYGEHSELVTVLSRQEHETANRLDNAEAHIDQLTAREAELVAKVEKYRAALALIAEDDGFEDDAEDLQAIARNALGEG